MVKKNKNLNHLKKIKNDINANSSRRRQRTENNPLENLSLSERLRLRANPVKNSQDDIDLTSTSTSVLSYLEYTQHVLNSKKKTPRVVGPIPASWEKKAHTSKFKAKKKRNEFEVLSLRDICITKIANNMNNYEIIRNFNNLSLHLKQLIMNEIPLLNVQITNEIFLNYYLESNLDYLNLTNSLVTYPILSTILKIKYLKRGKINSSLLNLNKTPYDTTNGDSSSSSSSNKKYIEPPESWEDIYDSVPDDTTASNKNLTLIETTEKGKEKAIEDEEDEDEDEEDNEKENEKLKNLIKKLENMYIKKRGPKNSLSNVFIEEFKGYRNLTSLNISYCCFLSSKMIPLIQSIAEALPFLQSLDLSGVLLELDGRTVLYILAKKFLNLHLLSLNDTPWLLNSDITSLAWNVHLRQLLLLQLKLCPGINQPLLTSYFDLLRPTLFIEY